MNTIKINRQKIDFLEREKLEVLIFKNRSLLEKLIHIHIILTLFFLNLYGFELRANVQINSIDLNLNNMVKYYIFGQNAVFVKTDEPIKRKHYKRLDPITHKLFSYNLETKHVDSTKFIAPYYLTINSKLNDSLFVIGYYDIETSKLINRYRPINKFRDSLFRVVEHIKIYNFTLKVIDSSILEYSLNFNQMRTLIPFIEFAGSRNSSGKLYLKNIDYNFPLIAKSYNDLVMKYRIIFKFNNFLCRHVSNEDIFPDNETPVEKYTEKELRDGKTELIKDDYWQILFSDKIANAYEYSPPSLFFKSSNNNYTERRKEKIIYYLNETVKYEDSISGATDYLILANYLSKELLIGKKTLPFYSSEGGENNLSKEKFMFYKIFLGNNEIVKEEIHFDKLIPTNVFFIYSGHYIFNSTNLDSVPDKYNIDNNDSMTYLPLSPVFDYWKLGYSAKIILSGNKIESTPYNFAYSPKIYANENVNGITIFKDNEVILSFDKTEKDNISDVSGNNSYVLYQYCNYNYETNLREGKFYYKPL